MISVHVNVPPGTGVPRALVEQAVREVLRNESVERAELSVTFLDDPGIVALHDRYLGRSGPTDVLSFALHGDGEDPVGDIYVGREQGVRQAREAGVEPGEEMVRLAVHGVLHALGYDHPKGLGRADSEMFRLQERVLAKVRGAP